MVGIVRTEWSGTSGGPGLTQFALLGAAGGEWNPGGEQAAVNAVRAFWFALAGILPDELRLTVNPVVDSYNRETGDLIASNTAGTVPAVVAGTSTTGYAGGAGLKITWNTGQIRNGRRVRGSTFIVPVTLGAFTNIGTVTPGTITTVNAAAANLVTALGQGGVSLGVWSRPRDTPNVRVGFATQVVNGSCSSKSAILRGRRD